MVKVDYCNRLSCIFKPETKCNHVILLFLFQRSVLPKADVSTANSAMPCGLKVTAIDAISASVRCRWLQARHVTESSVYFPVALKRFLHCLCVHFRNLTLSTVHLYPQHYRIRLMNIRYLRAIVSRPNDTFLPLMDRMVVFIAMQMETMYISTIFTIVLRLVDMFSQFRIFTLPPMVFAVRVEVVFAANFISTT